jgi:cobalt-zinc-cadmium efflux system outer membrane protein
VLLLVAAGCSSAGLPEPPPPPYVGELAASVAPAAAAGAPEAADPFGRPSLTVDEVAALAERLSPDVAAARELVSEAAGRAWQAGLPPNPALTSGWESPVGRDFVSQARATLGVSGTIVRGDRLRLAEAAEVASAGARVLAVEDVRRRVRADARRACTEILYVREALSLRRDLAASAAAALEQARARLGAKVATESEVIRQELSVREHEVAIAGGERRRAAAHAALAALLGGHALPESRIAGTLAPAGGERDAAALAARVRTGHPAVRAALAEVEAAQRAAEVAKAERSKDLSAFVAFGRDAMEDDWIVEAGVEIPIPFFDANQGRILETNHRIGRARAEAESLANALAAEVARACGEANAARAELTLVRDRLVPGAERALALAREGMAAGKLSSLDVLDAQRTLAEARLAALDRARDLALAEVEIRRLAGEEP